MSSDALARLTAETSVRYAPDVSLEFTTEPPPVDDVARAHVVAVTPPATSWCAGPSRSGDSSPAGRASPDETVADLIGRELREEAGYAPTGPTVFLARYVATSAAASPYRSHLPHPVSSWAYYVVPVEHVGEPLNPADGEHRRRLCSVESSLVHR